MEKKDNTFYQARAKILWGKPTEEVEEWLEGQGKVKGEIKEIIDECLAERAMDIRSSGAKKMFKWTFIALMTIILFILTYFHMTPLMHYRSRSLCGLVIFGFYCLVQLIDSAVTIIGSHKIPGSVIDIREE